MTWYLVGIAAIFATMVIDIASQRERGFTAYKDPWLAVCIGDDEEMVWVSAKEDEHEMVLPREESPRWVK
jgi:hypothetical protein